MKLNSSFKTFLLQDLCKLSSGSFTSLKEANPNGLYRFYTSAKDYTFCDHYSYDCEAIIIGRDGYAGQYIYYYKGKFNASYVFLLTQFKDNVYPLYLKYYLEENLLKLIKLNHYMIPHLKKSDLKLLKVSLPSLESQKLIGDFLTLTDQLINLHNRLINNIKLQKKYYLKKLCEFKEYNI